MEPTVMIWTAIGCFIGVFLPDVWPLKNLKDKIWDAMVRAA